MRLCFGWPSNTGKQKWYQEQILLCFFFQTVLIMQIYMKKQWHHRMILVLLYNLFIEKTKIQLERDHMRQTIKFELTQCSSQNKWKTSQTMTPLFVQQSINLLSSICHQITICFKTLPKNISRSRCSVCQSLSGQSPSQLSLKALSKRKIMTHLLLK